MYITFDHKPMALALESLGLAIPKIRLNKLPKFKNLYGYKSCQFLLAFVRAFYDGDGFSGTTRIGSISKQFLVRIKRTLKVNNPIVKMKGSYAYTDPKGFHAAKAFYTLSISTELMDLNELILLLKICANTTLTSTIRNSKKKKNN